VDRRRFALAALALAGAPVVARAQATTTECAVGFVNGILQFDPACPTLTMPGMPFGVAPPSHLVGAPIDETAATTAAQTAEQEQQEKLQAKRDKKRTQRSRRTNRQQEQKDGRRDRRGNRRDRRAAEARIAGCDDFDTHDEAQDYYMGVGYDRQNDPLRLDRNRDDIACNEMAPTPTPTPSPTPTP
jgi:hypothetical protein